MEKSEAIERPSGLCALTASQLCAGYAQGEFSPVDVVHRLFERYDAVNPVINAIYEVDRQEALRSAQASEQRWLTGKALGPLDGVPISVKDHLAVRGLSAPRAYLFSSRAASDFDCASASLLRAGGAILFGKSNMPELSVMPVTASTLFGETLHPDALGFSPGGSSGGAAAAVLAGLGPLALASDGGGSIRIPAAFAGLVGLKPTHGRVPYYPRPTDRTVAGPIGRTVADVARMMNVIARADCRDWTAPAPDDTDYVAQLVKESPPQRIALSCSFGYADVDPEVRAAVRLAAERLAGLGHFVEEQERICEDAQHIATVQAAVTMQGMLERLSSDERARLAPSTIGVLERVESMTLKDYRGMQEARDRLALDFHRIYERFDVILSPTVPHGPVRSGSFFPHGDILGSECRRIGALTRAFNLIHHPAISVPFGRFANGLPIGIQMAAPKYQEVRLLQLGAQVESLGGWGSG